MGPQVERQGAIIEAPRGVRRGWVSPSPLGVRSGEDCAPSPDFFVNFYIKVVSFRAFWVAISYRLADCFTRIGNTLELKFTGDRSSILGTRLLLPPKNCAAKMTKMHQKLLKEIARRLRCFFLVHFRIHSLKIFEDGGLGEWPQ